MKLIDNFEKLSGIYIIKNLINGKCYVGETINVYNRIAGHRNRVGAEKHRCLIHNAIKKYGYDNFEIYVEYFPNSTKEQLWDLEEQMIIKHNTLTPNGYNICSKGRGCVGLRHSEETKIKMSKNSHTKGKTGERCIFSKQVYVYNHITGEYVGSYIGYTEAARQLNLYSHSGICGVLSNKTKQCGGYVFKSSYMGDHIEPISSDTRKVIHCLDKISNDETVYESVSSAAKALGLSRASIRNLCIGKQHNKTYIMKYID